MKKHRFFSVVLALLMAAALTLPALALEDPQPHAGAAVVVDGDHGDVLYDFNDWMIGFDPNMRKCIPLR